MGWVPPPAQAARGSIHGPEHFQGWGTHSCWEAACQAWLPTVKPCKSLPCAATPWASLPCAHFHQSTQPIPFSYAQFSFLLWVDENYLHSHPYPENLRVWSPKPGVFNSLLEAQTGRTHCGTCGPLASLPRVSRAAQRAVGALQDCQDHPKPSPTVPTDHILRSTSPWFWNTPRDGDSTTPCAVLANQRAKIWIHKALDKIKSFLLQIAITNSKPMLK